MKKQKLSFLIWLVLSGVMFGCTKTETILAPAEDHVVTLALGFVSPVESELKGENILDVTIKNDSLGINHKFTIENPTALITPAGVCYQFKREVSLSVPDGKTSLWFQGVYHGFPAEVSNFWPSQDVSPFITVNGSQPFLAKDGWMFAEVSCAGDINFANASTQGLTQGISTKSWLWVSPNDAYTFPDGSTVHVSMTRAVHTPWGVVMQPVLCNSDWSVGVNVPTSHYQHRVVYGSYWGTSAQAILPQAGNIIGVQAILSTSYDSPRRVTELFNMSGLGQPLPDDPVLAPGYRLVWVYPSGPYGGKG